MRSGMVLGDLRVQKLTRSGGGSSYKILGPDASVVGEADDFRRPPLLRLALSGRRMWTGPEREQRLLLRA
jgi:hypothetical protein